MSSTPTKVSPFANIGGTLEDFTPRPAATAPPEAPGAPGAPEAPRSTVRPGEREKLAKLATDSGFKINNFREEPLPARIATDTKETFLKTVRIHVSDWNRFQSWCHENKYSHKRGFEVLTQPLPRPRPKS
jgi:hypothetical protein